MDLANGPPIDRARAKMRAATADVIGMHPAGPLTGLRVFPVLVMQVITVTFTARNAPRHAPSLCPRAGAAAGRVA